MLITGDAVEMPSKFVPSKIIVTRAVYAFLLSVWWYRSPPIVSGMKLHSAYLKKNI